MKSNKSLSQLISKTGFRLWSDVVHYTGNKGVDHYLYRSYWHYKFSKNAKNANNTCYFTARPNPGAGIGHQLANWMTGFWFAKQFGLKFAHISFSSQKWDSFLGLGEGEAQLDDLVKMGYRVRKLPVFDEHRPEEVDFVRSIIQSYVGEKIVFLTEQDQGYEDMYGVMDDLKQKFHHAQARCNDRLLYSKDHFNIACHVRRGDIVGVKHPNMEMRWQDNGYFVNALTGALKKINTHKPIAIYLFSQGEQNDFRDFNHFQNIHFCMDMNAQDSFLHMVHADLLITSKSSFSYKPALLNNGIKICPRDFWHGYPSTNDWILADEKGNFDHEHLIEY